MKNEKEIRQKKQGLIKDYTNLWASKGDTPKTLQIAKQIEILDWVLETKFITIREE